MYQSINDNSGGLNNKKINRTVATNVKLDDSVLLGFRAESNYTIDEFLKNETGRLKDAIGTTVFRYPKVAISPLRNVADDNDLRIVLSDSSENSISIFGDHSHLIKGIECDSRQDYKQDEQYDLIITFKTKSEIYNLIRDIVLDIEMFYFYKCDIKFPEIEDRKHFSLLKVKFCKFKGFINQNLEVRYLSLAMFANDGDKFDYVKYDELWKDFMLYLNSDDKYNKSSISFIELVNKIIEKHPSGMQLSKRYLLREISKTKDSRFLIVRTEKKPKTEKVRNQILCMLGGKKWKIGIVRIKKYSDIYLYEKYAPYVSVFVVER